MSLIFPGMDPYLENPKRWSDVHAAFIVYLREVLHPLIRPRYIASIEQRVFVEGPDRQVVPDVHLTRHRPEAHASSAVAVLEEEDVAVEVVIPSLEIRETYIALLDRESGDRIVTVIELVSPTNKYAGPGRVSYQGKQAEVLASDAHLVEIDLLRNGPHVLAVAEWASRGRGDYDYLIGVNRAMGDRSRYSIYPRILRHRLPRVRIPLAGDDPDAVLDLQAVLAMTYERGGYRDRLDYSRPCVPPLFREDQEWADGLIRAAGSMD